MTDDELLLELAGSQGIDNPEWVRAALIKEVRLLRDAASCPFNEGWVDPERAEVKMGADAYAALQRALR